MHQSELFGCRGQELVECGDEGEDQKHQAARRQQTDVDRTAVPAHANAPRRGRRRAQSCVARGIIKASPRSAEPYSGMKITCGVVKLVLWLLLLPYRNVTGPPLVHAMLRQMNLPAGTFTFATVVPT